jgi:hypothetical protein
VAIAACQDKCEAAADDPRQILSPTEPSVLRPSGRPSTADPVVTADPSRGHAACAVAGQSLIASSVVSRLLLGQGNEDPATFCGYQAGCHQQFAAFLEGVVARPAPWPP